MTDFAFFQLFSTFFDKPKIMPTLVLMLLLFYPLMIAAKRTTVLISNKFFSKIEDKYNKILKKYKLRNYLIHIYISLYLFFCVSLLVKNGILPQTISEDLITIAASIYVTLVFTSLLILLIDILGAIYNTKPISKKVPISLHTNILKILIVAIGCLVIISHILNISISALFASLGAAAALITFIFKDAAIGLVSGLHLTLSDAIRIGDWIQVPSHNADGVIEKITITTVLIRNKDNSVITVPSSSLLSVGFKNWRHMYESGSRKIQRAINIDIDSIKLLDEKELIALQKTPLLAKFVNDHPVFFAKGEKANNLKLFRYFIDSYLKEHELIHRDDSIIVVRNLDPTPDSGIPVEIYAYTSETSLLEYEKLLSEITEFMIISLPIFGLKFFIDRVS